MNKITILLLCIASIIICSEAVKPKKIKIDGKFDDWNDVTKYTDPDDAPDGSVVQDGIPDVHDTTHETPCDQPTHVINDDVNILEFAFAHDDDENFYAYMRAKGNISRTSVQDQATGMTAGRSYIQVVIDVDDNLDTGYCLNEGGYYPTGCGYDMHFELEMYNGTFNTAHYLLHAMNDTFTYNTSYDLQKQGLLDLYLLNGSYIASYKPYTEWVMWNSKGEDSITPQTAEMCTQYADGPYLIPDTEDVICFVEDKVQGPFKGIMDFAFSEDGHSVEMKAPWKGFMRYMNKEPVIKYGKMIHIAFSLEVSGEYSNPQGSWATDSTRPIRGYVIEEPEDEGNVTLPIWALALTVGGCVLVGGLIMLGALIIYKKHNPVEGSIQSAVARTKGYESIETPKGPAQ
mmetsp:Transcript_19972/g.27940  ORF Transcript_19972/g.27940 Transcript_19972/m.27940 type:complete len:401 (-) Transcript_19972:54-1256(-)